jgi:DNA-binding transcriptional MocR family regulator
VRPDALDAACRQHRPKAVYLIPTIQNPTTATLSQSRREQIARILRARDVPLIEDDAYGLLVPDAKPLATLIPERTWYAASLSKCIAPGLRISLVLTPDRAAAAALAGALRASVQMGTSLMIALVTRWLQDGSAAAIIGAIRSEAAARQKLAADILAAHGYARHPNGHHLWMPAPRARSMMEFTAHLRAQGLGIVTADAFEVTGTPPSAIRVSLGSATSRAELATALGVLAAALTAAKRRAG